MWTVLLVGLCLALCAVHSRKDWNDSKIAEDEPVFHLRAKDRLAPDVLDIWADKLEAAGGDKSLVMTVRRHANLMRCWQKKYGSKIPDAPLEALRGETEYDELMKALA